nr:MAG TPA: hypothetical protein [Caudoviricetes sp.]
MAFYTLLYCETFIFILCVMFYKINKRTNLKINVDFLERRDYNQDVINNH